MEFKIKDSWVRLDADDFKKIGHYRWKLDVKKNGKYTSYCSTHIDIGNKKYRDVPMHRMILGLKHGDKRMVDHINGDGLDNRRENLRFCTSQQNQMNRKPNKGYKYKGVSKPKHTRKWQARINFKGLCKHIGYYETAEEAAIAYNKAAKKMFGNYGLFNQVN